MIKAIIIDDEERGINVLSKLIKSYCPEIQLVGAAVNIDEAICLVRQHRPGVIFIDIEMPGRNGFQVLEQFEKADAEIIFVTAHSEYAIKALRIPAFDYLLKPVSIDELQRAVQRLINKQAGAGIYNHFQRLKDTLTDGNPFHKIILSTVNGYYFVQVADIIYCEADENYTHLFLEGQVKYTVSRPLKEFVDMFEAHNFFRIHKSYLINLNKAVYVNRDSSVIMNNKKELPIAFRKRAEFFDLLKDFSLV